MIGKKRILNSKLVNSSHEQLNWNSLQSSCNYTRPLILLAPRLGHGLLDRSPCLGLT